MPHLGVMLSRLDGGPARSLGAWTIASFSLLALLGPARNISGQEAREPPDDSAPSAPSDPVAELQRLEQAFGSVVERVAPCVVGIRAQRRVFSRVGLRDEPDGAARFEQTVLVNGSGTIIDARGLILTNEHVIQSADDIQVLFHDGVTRTATIVASDARSDMAVLEVDREGLTPAEPCDLRRVARGQWAVAVGNPYGLGADGKLSVSVGVISNLGRRLPGLGEVDDRLYDNMIQTTAEINPGNSGGPLFNLRGEIIGIVTAMHTRAGEHEGVGFAIPLTPTRWKLVDRLRAGESIDYGYIGLTVRTLTPDERAAANLDAGVGVLVEEVEPDGPADETGIVPGDVIVSFDDLTIGTSSEMVELVGAAQVGEAVPVSVRRGDRRLEVNLPIQRREASRVSWLRGGAILWRGMRLADLTSDSRTRMRVDSHASGVIVIDVVKGSPADRSSVRIGDVIERVAGVTVENIAAFRQTVRRHNGALRLRFYERGELTVQP